MQDPVVNTSDNTKIETKKDSPKKKKSVLIKVDKPNTQKNNEK